MSSFALADACRPKYLSVIEPPVVGVIEPSTTVTRPYRSRFDELSYAIRAEFEPVASESKSVPARFDDSALGVPHFAVAVVTIGLLKKEGDLGECEEIDR